MRFLMLVHILAVAFLGVSCQSQPPSQSLIGSKLQPLWVFEAPMPGSVFAAPLVAKDAVYLAAMHSRGFQQRGALYALEPATGKRKWAFDHDGDMLPTASTPVLADGRVVLGEGMHRNFVCNLYSLDPVTGRPAWTFPAADHIEAGPVVENGCILIPAGNDGIYAIDAATGRKEWNFQADLHIDSTPCVANGRVYVGSGPSRHNPAQALVCLDAKSGAVIWRTPTDLPAWGEPIVVNDRVLIGLGNGRLTERAKPPETPAGALACFEASTGRERWRVAVGDAIFSKPLLVGDCVCFGSRDGQLRGVSIDGQERFHVSLDGPVMASPAICEQGVVAVSVQGRIVCVNPADGREVWRYELSQTGFEPEVYASPRIVNGRLYVAAELRRPGSTVGIVTLQCFALPGSPAPQEIRR